LPLDDRFGSKAPLRSRPR